MISLITESNKKYEQFCRSDALGTRIMSQLFSYGTNLSFAMFWEQRNSSKELTAMISKIDGAVTIHSKDIDENNTSEIKEFINVIGYSSISSSKELLEMICSDCEISVRTIMKYNADSTNAISNSIDKNNLCGDINLFKIYDVITVCHNIQNTKDSYQSWIADMSHRIRHGYADAVCAQVNGQVVACALALAKTKCDVLLGGVATLNEFRNKGLARQCIDELIDKNSGKNIFIFCKQDKIEFYKKLGFEKYSNTAEVNK